MHVKVGGLGSIEESGGAAEAVPVIPDPWPELLSPQPRRTQQQLGVNKHDSGLLAAGVPMAPGDPIPLATEVPASPAPSPQWQ